MSAAPGVRHRRISPIPRERARVWAPCCLASTMPAASCAMPEMSAPVLPRRHSPCVEEASRPGEPAEKTPFVDPPKTRGLHWVKPQLVGEVSFAEWTSENHLRHPVFHGLRADKKPESIKREMPDLSRSGQAIMPRSVTKVVTNPVASKVDKLRRRPKSASKVGEPNQQASLQARPPQNPIAGSERCRRQDLGRWHRHQSCRSRHRPKLGPDQGRSGGVLPEPSRQQLLVHLKDRPVSMVRAPQGIAGAQMFQRHPRYAAGSRNGRARQGAMAWASILDRVELCACHRRRSADKCYRTAYLERHHASISSSTPIGWCSISTRAKALAFSAVIEATQLTVRPARSARSQEFSENQRRQRHARGGAGRQALQLGCLPRIFRSGGAPAGKRHPRSLRGQERPQEPCR